MKNFITVLIRQAIGSIIPGFGGQEKNGHVELFPAPAYIQVKSHLPYSSNRNH